MSNILTYVSLTPQKNFKVYCCAGGSNSGLPLCQATTNVPMTQEFFFKRLYLTV